MATKKKGRPRRFSNAHELQDKIANYFHACKEQQRIPTVSGLTYSLGFADSSALQYYATKCKAASHFSRTIRMALLRIQAEKVQWLLDGDLEPGRLRGLCFDLRVNGGMTERREPELRRR